MTGSDSEGITASGDSVVPDSAVPASASAVPPPASAVPPPASAVPPPSDPARPSRVRSFSTRPSSGTPSPARTSTGDSPPTTYQIVQSLSEADPKNIQEVAASQLALSNDYYENVLLQARRSFIAAIISATVGLLFFIAAVSIFLVRNDLRAGTVSVISGAIVEVISGLNFWLFGRTAAQLNLFHIRLEQTQKYLLANSISTKLSATARDTALIDLIKSMTTQGAAEDLPE
jgi:hypothetical protein